ncbi:MAG: PspC domain-containing protein [Anaerolineales bacterium]|nr:PspC domain-containing protein [Anaerolineales bacterium]
MSTKYKQLFRSPHDRMIGGVCGGLGAYLDIDPTIIRLIFLFGAIVTGSGLFWAYLIMMLLVPEESLAAEAVVDAPTENIDSPEAE